MAAETGVSCDAYFPLGDVHFCESHLSEVTGWGTQTTDTNTAVLFFEGWCVEIREDRVGLGGGCRDPGLFLQNWESPRVCLSHQLPGDCQCVSLRGSKALHLSWYCPETFTHTLTHTHIHKCIHTHLHMLTNMHIHTYAHENTYITYLYSYTIHTLNTCRHTHINIHTLHTYTCTQSHTHTCSLTWHHLLPRICGKGSKAACLGPSDCWNLLVDSG